MDDGRISAFPDRFGGSRADDDAEEESDREARSASARGLACAGKLRSVDTAGQQPKPSGLGAIGFAPTDLKPLADQLMAIARQLREAELGGRPPVCPETRASASAVELSMPRQAQLDSAQGDPLDPAARRRRFGVLARKTYAARRRRAAIFGEADLFGEPAWDILLDLYIAHVEGKDVSVSSACIGSAAPPTTGLRWLGVLAEHGMVVREHDPDDQRRVLVRLTERGLEAMDRYFALASGAL
jgi:hypothetical protein